MYRKYQINLMNSITLIQSLLNDSLSLWDIKHTNIRRTWVSIVEGCVPLPELGLKDEWCVEWFTHHLQGMTDNYMILTEHLAHSEQI